jgi:hypothetical protein
MNSIDYAHIDLLLRLHDDRSFVSEPPGSALRTELMAHGWLHGYQVIDALWSAGVRCNWQPVVRMAAALNLDADPIQLVYGQPSKSNGTTFGGEGMSAENFAATLIVLERYGFSVDPKPWIAALPPAHPRAGITVARLTAIRYPHERNNYTIQLASRRPADVAPFKRVIEKNGLKLTIDARDAWVRITGKKRAMKLAA